MSAMSNKQKMETNKAVEKEYWLFQKFPVIAGELAIPYSIGENFTFINCPTEDDIRELGCDIGAYRYIYPSANIDYGGSDLAICHECHSKEAENNDFWLLMLAFRLFKPCHIFVSGMFRGTLERPLKVFNLYWTSTGINSKEAWEFSLKDLETVYMLFSKLKKGQSCDDHHRLSVAISIFSAVTLGHSHNYSMLYKALFSALESLLGSPGEGKIISQRLGSVFEGTQYLKQDDFDWIKDEYDRRRNMVSHGNPIFWRDDIGKLDFNVGEEKNNTILRLHEITRLTLLGFFGLDSKLLSEYGKIVKKNKFKEWWNSNDIKASDEYLSGQRMFLESPYF